MWCRVLFICIALAYKAVAQVTLRVTNVPRYYTPLFDKLYVAGNFNNWNPGDSAYQLKPNTQGEYEVTIMPTTQQIEFKFTRGNWSRVEVNAAGNDIPNRSLLALPGSASSYTIADWMDTRGNHTATGNTYQIHSDFAIPQLNRTRRVWIYLPEDYFVNTNKRYPVMYMQDGQNLFDNATSFSGEWRIDETLRNLQNQQGDQGIIIVGIDNGGANRINEYSPYVNPQYGGGNGENYVDFLAQTLKPFIDANFRTLPDRNNTAIGGSSMGALISFYGALRHQAIFSKCLVFSPSFWFSDSLNQYVNTWVKTHDLRFYFMGGTNESSTMVSHMQNMRNRLISRGVPSTEINLVTKADGQHSEWFWAREFGDGYKWLFQNNVTEIEYLEGNTNLIRIAPNPNGGKFQIFHTYTQPVKTTITTIDGKVIFQKKLSSGADIDLSQHPSGVYLLTAQDAKVTAKLKIILKK